MIAIILIGVAIAVFIWRTRGGQETRLSARQMARLAESIREAQVHEYDRQANLDRLRGPDFYRQLEAARPQVVEFPPVRKTGQPARVRQIRRIP